MQDVKEKIQQLLQQREWTPEDRQWLQEYLHRTDAAELEMLMHHHFDSGIDTSPASTASHHDDRHPGTESLDPVLAQKILESIHEKIAGKVIPLRNNPSGTRTIRLAAACIAGLLALVTWIVVRQEGGQRSHSLPVQPVVAKTVVAPATHDDVSPGTKKAILTLSDGSDIQLDDARNGVLAKQGNTRLLKSDGKLVYQPSVAAAGKLVYNTITTPRGGEFHVELPDGSLVWLNAASSVRFPTAFTDSERRVEITGEAYFEIAADANKPFLVKIGNSEIQVLGTHFNVSGYAEEPTLRTTLLEGSVKFVHGDAGSILKPGQQARLTGNGKINVASNVDLPAIMAWKNGFFDFKGADIGTVMNQLSRWYDVEVVYTGDKTEALFYAEIPRDTKLSNVLKALELTSKLKLKFSIEDKKIIITN